MKRKIFLLLLPLLILSGCGKFLEEYSQNEIRPKHVSDLQMLMVGEAYPMQSYFVPYLELLTDDIDSFFVNNQGMITDMTKGEGAFTWSPDMFDMMKGLSVGVSDSWERYYSRIKACNIVLDYVNKVEGTVDEKEKVTGEALAIRSFYYFQIVNLWAKPYNAPGIDRATEPGIPLVLSPTVTDLYPARSTLQQVYDQIEGDLLAALPLMEKHGRNQTTKYRASDLFVHTLLSRFYLYTEQWAKAAEHAGIVLSRKSALINLTSLATPAVAPATVPTFPTGVITVGGYTTVAGAAPFALDSPELIWAYSRGGTGEFHYDYNFAGTSTAAPATYRASTSLKATYDYDLYDQNNRRDLRPTAWFTKWLLNYTAISPGVYTYEIRYAGQKSLTMQPAKGMRTAELYLNRAEANAQLFLAGGNDALRTAALADLNTLREARFDTRTVAYTPVAITNGQELLQFVRDERRRELCWEEHRWFDLRRWGMPEIRHTFKRDNLSEPQEYTLEQGDARYVLPIASWVLARNPNLQ